MNYDAFTAGINLGGLRNTLDIKVLICYILSGIKAGISREDMVSILVKNEFANYFEAANAFNDLIKNNNISAISENNHLYIITESGKLIANQLVSTLPFSIREKALSAAINLLAKIKRENENKVTIEKDENGYKVTFYISGGTIDLLCFYIYVPDLLQANLVKENFQQNPNNFYECILALLTKNNDIIENALNNLNKNIHEN